MCFDDVGAPNQIRPDGAVPPGAIKVPGVCEDIFGQDGIQKLFKNKPRLG